MIPTLRTLTKKSKLGFGKYKNDTVGSILDRKQKLVLIAPYFKLTSINYTEDVLIELGIDEDYRIDKPSKNIDEYYRFLNDKGYEKRRRGVGPDKLKKFTKQLTKSQLQSMNHGR